MDVVTPGAHRLAISRSDSNYPLEAGYTPKAE